MRRNQTAMIGVLAVVISFFIVAVTVSSGDKTFTGEELYRLNCASCHGADRAGYAPHYPSLLDVKDKLSQSEILERMAKGKNRMPAFPHLSRSEKDAIVAFLLGEQPRRVELTTAELGERIFRSNCASCHRATINDPRPSQVWMMEPPPLAGATKRFTKSEFLSILKTGVCYMPSFEHFTSPEREALYSFIKSLEGQGEPDRPTMGEMCPMMMRMRRGNN